MAESNRWPRVADYEQALLLGDIVLAPSLKGLVPERRPNRQNSLRFREGNFGAVVRLRDENRTVAAKVFKRFNSELETRYVAIKKYLADFPTQCLVGFDYIEHGIFASGDWRPVLAMEWCPGQQLDGYLRNQLLTEGGVDSHSLCLAWLEVVNQLRRHGLAHCDLQHGNVFVDPEDLTMRLVDYDGMKVPSMSDLLGAPDRGHPAYQHPYRTEGDVPVHWDDRLDCFSALVVLANLSAMSLQSWERFNADDGDRLLTGAEDLSDPRTSEAMTFLRSLPQPTNALVELLTAAIRNPDSADEQLGAAAELFGLTLLPIGPVSPQDPPVRSPPDVTPPVSSSLSKSVSKPDLSGPEPVVEEHDAEASGQQSAPEGDEPVIAKVPSKEAGASDDQDEPMVDADASTEWSDDVERAILGLTERQRSYVRCFLAGRPPEETARLLRVKPSTVVRRQTELTERVGLVDASLVARFVELQEFAQLTNRQLKVLEGFAESENLDAVASAFKVKQRTVVRHLSAARKRLLANDGELVAAAVQTGLIGEQPAITKPGAEVVDGLISQPRPKPSAARSGGGGVVDVPPRSESVVKDLVGRVLTQASLLVFGLLAAHFFGWQTFVTTRLPGNWVIPLVLALLSFVIGVLISDNSASD